MLRNALVQGFFVGLGLKNRVNSSAALWVVGRPLGVLRIGTPEREAFR